MTAQRRRTRKRGIYSVHHEDGSRSYVATWKVARPLTPTDPLATRPRTVEREAATFEAACLLQAEGQAKERKRQDKPPESWVERLGQRMMAFKYFEYRGRR